MRLGVLDVGSNTVHLLVVDAHRGGHPTPTLSESSPLRLAELVGEDGRLGVPGSDALVGAVDDARRLADRLGAEDLVAFATSATRDAADAPEVLARVQAETGVHLRVLSGRDEARVTFLAVRRWFGWSAGRILGLDIGGGSLEVATGVDEVPDEALSFPLGAGRLTRERLPGDPPRRRDVAALREHVREELALTMPVVLRAGEPELVVATSKTFRSLARVAGAAPSSRGPRVPRELTRKGVAGVVAQAGRATVAERAGWPGVSPRRAHQLLAGAVVAEVAMDLLSADRLRICPWALREGVVLTYLDALHDRTLLGGTDAAPPPPRPAVLGA